MRAPFGKRLLVHGIVTNNASTCLEDGACISIMSSATHQIRDAHFMPIAAKGRICDPVIHSYISA